MVTFIIDLVSQMLGSCTSITVQRRRGKNIEENSELILMKDLDWKKCEMIFVRLCSHI